ncbi:MAG: hypothetical protein ABEH83_13570 [Halobacterium sp.]
MNRRRVLAATAALFALPGLSGCNESQSVVEVDDVSVTNETTSEQTITVRVTRDATGETVLDETVDVPASESANTVAFSDPVDSDGHHHVRVDVDDGPSETYDWDIPGRDGEQDEAYGLAVVVSAGLVEFEEVAA